jgi:hypothetical protein
MRKWYYSGICKCGHSWEDHHLSLPMSQRSYLLCEGLGQPPVIPGACEYYGSGEHEGKMPLNTKGEDYQEWIEHCSGYRDKDEPSA